MSRGEQYNPASAGEHVQRMLQDWYYAPRGAGPGGAGVWQPLPEGVIPFEFKDDATSPGTPTAYQAYRLAIDSSGQFNVPLDGSDPDEAAAIWVFDLTGQIRALGYTTMNARTPPQHGGRGWCVRSDPNADEPAGQSPAFSIVGYQQPPLLYAKVQGGYTNFGMLAGFCQNSTGVPVQLCDADGSHATGGIFTLPLPSLGDTTSIPPSRSPALFAGDIIKLAHDQSGQLAIADYGAHIDDAGGTVRMQIYAQIPRGWSAYALMQDRMPIGSGGIYSPEWTGGGIYPDHRHALDTTTFGTAWCAAGANVNALTSIGQNVETGDEEPILNLTPPYLEQPPTYMPPYCPLQFIVRTS